MNIWDYVLEKTKEYFDALFDVFYQYQDQGYYDFALETLKEINKQLMLIFIMLMIVLVN